MRDLFVPVDFAVLDVNPGFRTPIILGRPFLSTTNATINVGARVIQLIINEKEEIFCFHPDISRAHPQWKSMPTMITECHSTHHDHHGEESKAP